MGDWEPAGGLTTKVLLGIDLDPIVLFTPLGRNSTRGTKHVSHHTVTPQSPKGKSAKRPTGGYWSVARVISRASSWSEVDVASRWTPSLLRWTFHTG